MPGIYEGASTRKQIEDELMNRQGGSVNLPGWDASRTDNDPKQVFGRFAQDWQASGKPWGAEAVRTFVAQDPRWEFMNAEGADPLLRVKQGELDKWKPGQSIWQDVIRDAGGANGIQFINAAGQGEGFAPQGQYAPQNGGMGAVSPYQSGLDYGPMTSGPNALTNQIHQLVSQLMGGDNNAFLRALMEGKLR